MKNLPLTLSDLKPAEAVFKLSTLPNTELTLCRWSLRVRGWAVDKFGAENLQSIFEKQKIQEIAEIAWYMLKEKSLFSDDKELQPFDKFLDSISTIQDQISLVKALLYTIGIGEPEIEKISKSLEGNPNPNPPSPNPAKRKIGAKSLTP